MSNVAPTVDSEQFKYSEFMRFMNKVSDGEVKIESSQQPIGNSWTEEFDAQNTASAKDAAPNVNQESDWIQDFEEHKARQGVIAAILFFFFNLFTY